MGEDAGKRAGSIELSPRVQARLRTYCRAQGLQETAFLSRVILERLDQEESLERCCQAWDALLKWEPPRHEGGGSDGRLTDTTERGRSWGKEHPKSGKRRIQRG